MISDLRKDMGQGREWYEDLRCGEIAPQATVLALLSQPAVGLGSGLGVSKSNYFVGDLGSSSPFSSLVLDPSRINGLNYLLISTLCLLDCKLQKMVYLTLKARSRRDDFMQKGFSYSLTNNYQLYELMGTAFHQQGHRRERERESSVGGGSDCVGVPLWPKSYRSSSFYAIISGMKQLRQL